MAIDIPTIVTVISVLLALGTFFLGRVSAGRELGKEAGSLQTDVRYIKASIERIEKRLGRDVERLSGRIDALAGEMAQVRQELVSQGKETASAHRRMDEHLQREHKQG